MNAEHQNDNNYELPATGLSARCREYLARAKRWARAIKRDVLTLWLAARDPRVPWHVKLLCAAIAAYALSPIDLIPDFIPVLGYLDDIILLPLAIALAVRLIPPDIIQELREDADRRHARPVSRGAAVVIVIAWIASAALIAWLLWPSAFGV